MTATSSQLEPEKLPKDQLCRFTMDWSSAKAMRKFVAAEQMYPTMTPATMSMAMELMRRAMRSTKPMVISEPRNAAATMAGEDMAWFAPRSTIIVSATTNFAPEETPKMNGSAMGLLKNVCSRNPESESAPPRSTAESTRGRRISQMTWLSMELAAPPERMPGMWSAGTSTLPMHRLVPTSTMRATASSAVTTRHRAARPDSSYAMESRLLMVLAELPQIMEVARVIAGERPVQLIDNVGGRGHLLVHVGACDPDVAVLHGFELRQ